MDQNTISLKPIKDLLGMNFFIPDYQRGYRWEEQQAIDLLEDFYAFSNKQNNDEEIYCIQPLVVSEKKEEKEEILAKCKRPESTIEDIKDCIVRYMKGSWTVVDGQQRLTTIYLVLNCLEIYDSYEINYLTRKGSKDFLTDISNKTKDDAISNVDFYHLFLVYSTIKNWLSTKDEKTKNCLRDTLLYRVNFIWYQIRAEDEISVFTRLNIGKIPLTDAELIKALFLNRANFRNLSKSDEIQIETIQREIAMEWDHIEQSLQNDEFWAFLHDLGYNKPTRIDYILEAIYKKDVFNLKDYSKDRNSKNPSNQEQDAEHKKEKQGEFGTDNHQTFRYFNEVFSKSRSANEFPSSNIAWLRSLWSKVKEHYQIFTEWYNDYHLYHYIGYLSTIKSFSIDCADLISDWKGKTKPEFIDGIKELIANHIKKKAWVKELHDYQFDQEKSAGKRECIDILLLHNIETIIQQNDKLVSETKYNLPVFDKFPFHLYKKEKWEVEHIRPNAGDDLKKEEDKLLYLSLASKYLSNDKELTDSIHSYLNNEKNRRDFSDILSEILQKGGSLPEEDKNKIWNYVLLDGTTNKEYGNQIFPVKRAFIANKERGRKVQFSYINGKLEETSIPEIAFVPPCTKNVFSKFYTAMPTTMINWNIEDGDAYWNDMSEKLNYYFSKIGIKGN